MYEIYLIPTPFLQSAVEAAHHQYHASLRRGASEMKHNADRIAKEWECKYADALGLCKWTRKEIAEEGKA